MGHLPIIIAGSLAQPTDLLILLAAAAVVTLLALPRIVKDRREAREARARERQIQADVDRAAARPGQLDAIGRTVYTPLPTGEGVDGDR